MKCFVPSCKKRKIVELHKHIMRSHKQVYDSFRIVQKETTSPEITITCQEIRPDADFLPSSSDEEGVNLNSGGEEEGPSNSDSDFEEEFCHRVPSDKSCKEVVAEMFEHLIRCKESTGMNDHQFVSIGVTFFSAITTIIERHDRSNILYKISKAISSTWNLNKFIQENFSYTHPEKYIVSGNERYRIPLKSIIKRSLGNESIRQMLIEATKYVPSSDGSIACFRDTENFKSDYNVIMQCLQQKNCPFPPFVIFYDVYIDDFGLANPIGPSASNSTVLAVYVSLSDIPLKHKSKREDQSLITIIPRLDVSDSGLTSSLSHIKQEFMNLSEQGFIHNIQGTDYCVHVIINKICGDNSGIFEVLGLQKSWTSGHICRVCNATHRDIQIDPFAKSATLRTDEQVLKDTHTLLTEGKVCHGQHNVPVFIDMKFMTSTNQYPNDRLHVLILGVYTDFLEVLLHKLLRPMYIQYFNDRIKHLKFKNGSAILKVTSGGRNHLHLKGIASQVYEVFLNLPELLVSVIFDSKTSASRKRLEGDDMKEQKESEWREIITSNEYLTYLTLRKLDCYVNQPKYLKDHLTKMGLLVDEFFLRRSECSFIQTVTPKLHYLTHIVHDTTIHGPLINYDTLRYERRHSIAVQKIRSIKCARNYSKTLVEWDCRLSAIRGSNCSKTITLIGSKRHVSQEELTMIGRIDSPGIYKVRGVIWNGEEMRERQVCQVSDGFIQIKLVISATDGFFCFGKKYFIRSLNEYLHAYQVYVKSHNLVCIEVGNFPHLSSPLRLFEFNGNLFINKIIN